MKRFRFATSHLVMIGIILFGILGLSVRLISQSHLLMMFLFLISAGLVALLYYQKKTYELSELEQIELLNDQTEENLLALLEQMPVGVIQFDPETDKIEWFNPFAELVFSKEDGELDTDLIREIIQQKKDGAVNQTVQLADNSYALDLDLASGMFYFYNLRAGKGIEKQEVDLQPVIGVISVDNYDDMIDTFPDAEISQINGFIANFITKFSSHRSIFYRRVSMDRFYFFTDYAVLKELMDGKLTVLEDFRKEAQTRDLSLTISMGISYGQTQHSQIGQTALKNLNIALVRGGDQAVISENGDQKELLYFGGGSVSTVKRSRTRTRAMMTAISDKIKTVDQVFVVGHRNLDMDALGSSVAMQTFATNICDQSYLVYDDQGHNGDITRALASLKKDGKTKLLTVNQALEQFTDSSLLIMVDHSRLTLTLSRELYDKFTEVVIVDHHRRSEDFPQNAILSFIESGASSASELATELLQFQNAKQRLSKIQASIVMAGIMLDTKRFTTRVTSRTFDVASYLRSLGSDSIEIQNISALDFDEYREVNALILKGEKILPNILIAKGDERQVYSNLVVGKAVDTMLTMSGIEASFVISQNDKGDIAVSARSRGKINVQRIMEEMGGGGHFNLAACQRSDDNIKNVYQLLLEKISQELKEKGDN